jgi:hypothetical protein
MPRFVTTAEHYISSPGILIPAGTEVGDGTSYPWFGPPSLQMEGVDDEGKRLVGEARENRINPITGLRIGPDNRFGSELAADDPGRGGAPQPGPANMLPANNPIYRTTEQPLQPIIPSPSEHVQPGPGGRPDPFKSPEDREADRDKAIDMAAVGGPGRNPGVPPGGLAGVDTRRILDQDRREQRITDGEPAPQPPHPSATPLPGQEGKAGPKVSGPAGGSPPPKPADDKKK